MEHSSLHRMSAAMIDNTLLGFAIEPLRKFVRTQSDLKSLATLARWLAGLAWKPLGNGQTNVNSSSMQVFGIIRSTLDSFENGSGVGDRLTQRYFNNAHAFETLATFNTDIYGENRHRCLANIVFR